MNLSAVVIVKDEEENIGDCLESVCFCDEMIVVDSGSTDRTVKRAKEAGAKVFLNHFKDFASQKNFGIAEASGEWVLLVDADERVSPALAVEIRETLKSPVAEGYFFPRQNKIFGRWMRYGSNRGDYQLRLVRREAACFKGIVHERIDLQGKTLRLKNHLMHHSTKSISAGLKKLNCYTSMDAGTLHQKTPPLFVHLQFRPLAVFLYRTFWQRAILDGLEGVMFAVFNAYYEFVRYAKSWELALHNEKEP